MATLNETSTLTDVSTLVGQPMTLRKKAKVEYETSSGTTVYDKILTGFKPILFPTAVGINSCFEYRFSIKDLMLPKDLPSVTDLYFKDLVVKIQDMFTQINAEGSIIDGGILSYMPYSAVLAQDENGLETSVNNLTINGVTYENLKFINSERIIKRDSSPLFVVSSNLKFNKSFNLDVATNSYKALGIYAEYDSTGKLVKKFIKPKISATVDELRQIFYPESVEKANAVVCLDIILCDILIFCLKSFNLDSTKKFEDVGVETLKNHKPKRSIPIGWMTPEEKLEKFGKKGTFKNDYDLSTNPLPASEFLYVDMQEKSDALMDIAVPSSPVFIDKNHVISPVTCHYTVVNELVSVRVKSDN